MRTKAAAQWPVILGAALLVGALVYVLARNLGGSAGGPGAAGVGCLGGAPVAYHVHAHLAIRIDGQPEAVPANIGLTATCTAWIHTHTDGGIIHLEAPGNFRATLGMFFDLWGQPLSATRLGDHAVSPGEAVYAFVDGERWTGDLRTIPLNGGPVIELQVGPASLPPLPYRFPSDLR